MAANDNNDAALGEVMQELQAEVGHLRDAVGALTVNMAEIAGLNDVAGGVAQVVEMLQPLRELVPRTIYQEFPLEAAAAIDDMQRAIGFGVDRGPAPDTLPIENVVVPFIGAAGSVPIPAAAARAARAVRKS